MINLIDQVSELCSKVTKREIIPVRLTEEHWDEQFCGSQVFKIGDWVFSIFNDCGGFDYIEYVVDPSGVKHEDDALMFDVLLGDLDDILQAM